MINAQPLFSIVLPVYNRASIVGRAIKSVKSQTCQDFEIIVIDDGSTDNLKSVLDSLPDQRIRLVRQANSGASAARNHGIDVSLGKYIAFLDSDDAFLPCHLETMERILSGKERVVAYSPVRAQRGNDYVIKPPRAIAPGEPMAIYLMCGRGFVQTSSLVVPAAGARRVRYRHDVFYGDDTDFAIRLQLAGYRFVMADKPSVDWFDGPDPARLSNAPLDSEPLAWLEDLKPHIPKTAYHAYRGWHVAKGIFCKRPLTALRLYFVAVVSGAYRPSVALVVFAQIIVPRKIYRDCSNLVISLIPWLHKAIKSERSVWGSQP